MHSHTNRRIANCAYTISYKADHRLIIMYIRKIWISSTISIHTMNAHMHHRCWRHRAQVRSAEAGICKVERFTATDLAISLQFRWDYFQDILIYYKCHVHTDTCDVYIIHVLCHLNIRCLYSYISCIIYICLPPTPCSENSQIPSSCGESFATWCFFSKTPFSDPSTKRVRFVVLLFLHLPKLTCPLKIWGAWKTIGPFFGDMLVFGVYSMHYIHTALLILVDSPIPNIDLLAGLWPCSKDATLRRCCCCSCTEKELRNATRIRFLKKKWNPQKQRQQKSKW